MTPEARRQYINLKRERYQVSSSKQERGQMLGELVRDGIYRNIKSANRAMLQVTEVGSRIHQRGRKAIYNDITKACLKQVWLDAGSPNSIRLSAIMNAPYWMNNYNFSDEIKNSLKRMGKSSIDEFLKPIRIEMRRRANSTTKPSDKTHLKGIITQRIPFVKIERPGYLETDTVSHSGGTHWGNFGYTINATDIYSGWSEQRMIKGKEAKTTVDALEKLLPRLPIAIVALYFDSGSEFFNYEMERKFGEKMILQHSRPQKKNDQAHVEQKNDTHVRKLLGYERYEALDVIEAINDLYENEWSILNNYFMPQMKLNEKIRVKSKLKKKYDLPKTPLERLIESKTLSSEKEEELLRKRDSYNPVELRKIVDRKLKSIKEMIQVSENEKKVG